MKFWMDASMADFARSLSFLRERERERILFLMSWRHIRDKLYETLNSNCCEQNWLAIK